MKNKLLAIIFLITGLASFAQMPDKTVIFTEKAPKPIGPYSQAIFSGNTLYVSGQIAIDPETGVMDTTTIETEIRRVLKNLEEVLTASGMSFDHVVKTTIYTTDLKHFKTINTIYGEYFKARQPARETVQVAALPGKAHVEISCIAVRKPEILPAPVRDANE